MRGPGVVAACVAAVVEDAAVAVDEEMDDDVEQVRFGATRAITTSIQKRVVEGRVWQASVHARECVNSSATSLTLEQIRARTY